MFAGMPPTQSICATFLPARSAGLAIVSAWSTPAPENEVRFAERVTAAEEGVVRRAVLGLGYVPVAIVYQPTPVFGGNDWTMPLSPVTPSLISFL